MKYVSLAIDTVRELPFYLAMEEYVARLFNEEAFFMWQVEPTVIFGRNQLIESEVNLPYCKSNNIHTYRRKSGGGCVYADMSNIMFSYITSSENVQYTYDHYISLVVDMLKSLGVNAEGTGRNDIMIDGKKVSGNAFYHIPGRSIVHGTMLYDTEMENMVKSITPSDDKLISKGVKSVRNRITTLNQYLDISITEFMDYVRKYMCDGEITLDSEDVKRIEEIEQSYLSDNFIYGNNPEYTLSKKERIEGVGEFVVRLELKGNKIKNVDVAGDYFLVGELDNQLLDYLKGVEYNRNCISDALKGIEAGNVIHNITKEEFIKLLI